MPAGRARFANRSLVVGAPSVTNVVGDRRPFVATSNRSLHLPTPVNHATTNSTSTIGATTTTTTITTTTTTTTTTDRTSLAPSANAVVAPKLSFSRVVGTSRRAKKSLPVSAARGGARFRSVRSAVVNVRVEIVFFNHCITAVPTTNTPSSLSERKAWQEQKPRSQCEQQARCGRRAAKVCEAVSRRLLCASSHQLHHRHHHRPPPLHRRLVRIGDIDYAASHRSLRVARPAHALSAR